ncbi:MAG: hypothetical protein FVQ85_09470 [Planctomycetes bacterium]|nr:hypothetical protein [Planctomycetota bacterium]
MKKLIVLLVVVVAILAVIKMIGVDVSLSPESSQGDKDKGIYNPYQVTQEGNRPKDIIGMPLPKTAVNGRGPAGYLFGPNTDEPTTYKLNWLVVKIPREDFYTMVERLGLIKKPDLLEIWPEAFECEFDKFDKFWDLKKSITEDTYFIEDLDEETYRVFKYENGNLYVKKSTTYLAFRSETNELLYKKAKK